MHEKTILLVEDNPDDIALAQRAFRKCGLEKNIIIAHDGIEALNYLFSGEEDVNREKINLPAVVLLDIKMPGMNGIEVLKQIRSQKRTAYLPIVMLTSSDNQQDIVQCYKFGANSYILKPVDFIKFQEVMRHLGFYWLTANKYPVEIGI